MSATYRQLLELREAYGQIRADMMGIRLANVKPFVRCQARGFGAARCWNHFHWLFLRYLSKKALIIGSNLESPTLTVCPCEVISRVVSTPAALSAAANSSP